MQAGASSSGRQQAVEGDRRQGRLRKAAVSSGGDRSVGRAGLKGQSDHRKVTTQTGGLGVLHLRRLASSTLEIEILIRELACLVLGRLRCSTSVVFDP